MKVIVTIYGAGTICKVPHAHKCVYECVCGLIQSLQQLREMSTVIFFHFTDVTIVFKKNLNNLHNVTHRVFGSSLTPLNCYGGIITLRVTCRIMLALSVEFWLRKERRVCGHQLLSLLGLLSLDVDPVILVDSLSLVVSGGEVLAPQSPGTGWLFAWSTPREPRGAFSIQVLGHSPANSKEFNFLF